MKKWLVGAGLALFCLNASAGPVRKAMVLSVSGPVVAHPSKSSDEKVITGQMWSEGCQVDLPAGSSVTVLLLTKGERLQVDGGGKFLVAADGLVLQGCKSTLLSSNQHKLALTGENHRQIGGMTVRSQKPSLDVWIDSVAVAPEGITVSMPAGSGQPPPLTFDFYYNFSPPNLSEDLQRVHGPEKGMNYAHPVIQGKTDGSRWTWTAPWNSVEDFPPVSGLSLVAADENKLPLDKRPDLREMKAKDLGLKIDVLYTRINRLTPDDWREIGEAKVAAENWAQTEPGSIQPWVVYANLLDEKGCLEEANQVLDKALAIEPNDEGLRQMKSRILMDLGRYGQAATILRKPK